MSFLSKLGLAWGTNLLSTEIQTSNAVTAMSWLNHFRRERPHQAAMVGLRISTADHVRETAARDLHLERGRSLAAAGHWNQLSDALAKVDAGRSKTPCGMPIGELLAQGARMAIAPKLNRIVVHGLGERDALLRVLGERAVTDHRMAAVLALAHIEAAQACEKQRLHRKRGFYLAGLHYRTAAHLLAPFDAEEEDSPLLASAQCGLLAGRRDARHHVVRDYEVLIRLDPANPNTMRALGRTLLPSAYGDYDRLEAEAVRIAALTRQTWGEGGYTWVMLDAIRRDFGALARLDVDFFIDGMRDILARTRSQATVNLFAAVCAVAESHSGPAQEADIVGYSLDGMPVEAPTQSARMAHRLESNRKRLTACSDWVVRDHLCELHPTIWFEMGRKTPLRTKHRISRRNTEAAHGVAMNFLARRFSGELKAGKQVVFTENGLKTDPR